MDAKHNNLSEKLKDLPQKPGVYQMIDSLGNIIYVGKAKNLKNRVSQYFSQQKNRSSKVNEMIQNMHTLQYLVTDTELDALLDECRLIKELQPRYNRLMKNYKKYIFIKIPSGPFPKLELVQEKNDDGIYYGPFTSPHRVKSALEFIREFYPIRKCPHPGLVKRTNGCFYRQMGTCLGVCTGEVSPDEYRVHLEKIGALLRGADRSPLQELCQRMDTASQNLHYEKAAQYHEYYLGLKHVINKQQLVLSAHKNRLILAVEFIDQARIKLFLIQGNKLLRRKMLDLKPSTDQTGLSRELKQFMQDSPETEKNSNQLTQYDIDEAQIIYSYLKKNKNRILSFWIPARSGQQKENKIEAKVLKIINRINAR